ncbi:hypothetical protein QVD17_31451 [Tagetes erecta]|uniref:Uncharacterized protein n=1 Tax=Tagetes erecta TaxID=13708 RepID=A0AAD8NP75_TARER|nr:hypothetical protein QVD17_31451 [Tagetes erecta]
MSSKYLSSNLDHDHDESEETVSLCDLHVHGDDTTYNTTTPLQDHSMKADESFEFFNQEWLKNNKDLIFSPNKDTIFGGNWFIPTKPISKNIQDFKKRDHQGTSKVEHGPSFSSSSSCGSCKNNEFAKLMSMNKGRNHGGKNESKRVFPGSGSMKSRWYYYGFGLAGIPAEMDLSAIKSRQNRHRKSRSVGGVKAEDGGFGDGKGLGKLIRELSCDGETQAKSMVKASLVCIPRV